MQDFCLKDRWGLAAEWAIFWIDKTSGVHVGDRQYKMVARKNFLHIKMTEEMKIKNKIKPNSRECKEIERV